jgi:hypothetical protein
MPRLRDLMAAMFSSKSGLRLTGLDDSRTQRSRPDDEDRARAVARENRLAARGDAQPPIDSREIDPRDPRWVLAMQTQARLQGAMLPVERREELMRSGRRLGLRPFEANLVIAVMQDRARRGEQPATARPTLKFVPVADPGPSPASFAERTKAPSRSLASAIVLMRWFAAGALAAAVATLVIRWLTGTLP